MDKICIVQRSTAVVIKKKISLIFPQEIANCKAADNVKEKKKIGKNSLHLILQMAITCLVKIYSSTLCKFLEQYWF